MFRRKSAGRPIKISDSDNISYFKQQYLRTKLGQALHTIILQFLDGALSKDDFEHKFKHIYTAKPETLTELSVNGYSHLIDAFNVTLQHEKIAADRRTSLLKLMLELNDREIVRFLLLSSVSGQKDKKTITVITPLTAIIKNGEPEDLRFYFSHIQKLYELTLFENEGMITKEEYRQVLLENVNNKETLRKLIYNENRKFLETYFEQIRYAYNNKIISKEDIHQLFLKQKYNSTPLLDSLNPPNREVLEMFLNELKYFYVQKVFDVEDIKTLLMTAGFENNNLLHYLFHFRNYQVLEVLQDFMYQTLNEKDIDIVMDHLINTPNQRGKNPVVRSKDKDAYDRYDQLKMKYAPVGEKNIGQLFLKKKSDEKKLGKRKSDDDRNVDSKKLKSTNAKNYYKESESEDEFDHTPPKRNF